MALPRSRLFLCPARAPDASLPRLLAALDAANRARVLRLARNTKSFQGISHILINTLLARFRNFWLPIFRFF